MTSTQRGEFANQKALATMPTLTISHTDIAVHRAAAEPIPSSPSETATHKSVSRCPSIFPPCTCA
jgi:hypothetical protein